MVVLSAFGGTRGTNRHCGGTTEYWVVLEVLWSNRGVLWGTVGYFRVWLGTTGYSGGTRCILGQGGVLGGLWDTVRYYGYWDYLGLLRGSLRYCRLL